MILLPILALAIGFALAFLVKTGPIRGAEAQYLAVACLAGIDSICGGIRSGIEGKFHTDVFVTGFFANTIIAFGLALLGDRVLYINLFLAVALILGGRIFTNLSLIRRYLITKWQDAKERQRMQALAQASTTQDGG